MNTFQRAPVWLLLAVASGVCAAFNGVFAKLTTTSLTTTWSHSISSLLSLSPSNTFVEYTIRALFFGLNVLFNMVMWGLFTAALTRASTTTRVSVINVSSNFTATALLGAVIFGEKLPGLWWVGAGLLAVGNVVIGRREEKQQGREGGETGTGEGGEAAPLIPGGEGDRDGDEVQDQVDLMDLDGEDVRQETSNESVRKGDEVDAPL